MKKLWIFLSLFQIIALSTSSILATESQCCHRREKREREAFCEKWKVDRRVNKITSKRNGAPFRRRPVKPYDSSTAAEIESILSRIQAYCHIFKNWTINDILEFLESTSQTWKNKEEIDRLSFFPEESDSYACRAAAIKELEKILLYTGNNVLDGFRENMGPAFLNNMLVECSSLCLLESLL